MRVGILGGKQCFLLIKERLRLAENLRSAHCSPFAVSKVLAKLKALLACSQRPWFDLPVSELYGVTKRICKNWMLAQGAKQMFREAVYDKILLICYLIFLLSHHKQNLYVRTAVLNKMTCAVSFQLKHLEELCDSKNIWWIIICHNQVQPLHPNEAWFTTIYMKMSLLCMWMKSDFHMKDGHQDSLSERG